MSNNSDSLTNGSLSTVPLREGEESKIECARRFFDSFNANADSEPVRYDVVTSYAEPRQLVG